ncbi:hypothetical protein Tco_0266218 [Tanacetum coccineum]
MAALKYHDEHNRIGFLEKPKGSTDYHQVIDFLLGSHIRYAIVTDPLIHDSLITQFWSTASLRSSELGPPAIVATIDGTPYTITESLVRSQLQLQDEGELFLQMILDIETRHTKPYHAVRLTSKMFANMRLNFHGDHMPLVAAMLLPPQAAIAAGTSGEVAPPNPQTDHETVTEPVHPIASPRDHGSSSPRPTPTAPLSEPVSTPPWPIPTSPSAQVNQSGPSSDPHVESSSKENASNPVPRSTATPLKGEEIGCLESELQAYKLLFKDVMGKLVKQVKFLESKLKAKGRNVILSKSDNEEDKEQDVDSLIKLAKAAAFAADTSSVLADATQENEFPPSSSIPTDAFVHGNAVPAGNAYDFSADPSNKGKSPMVEEDPPIKERSFRQIEEDRLGAEAARKLYEEEKAELAREQKEMKKKSSAIYSTGWTLKYVKTFTDDQLKAEFDKIRNAAADLQAQNLRRSLKRPGADVEQPGSKKSKSSAAPQTPVHMRTSAVSSGPRTRSQSFDADIKTYSTRRKSLAPRKMPSSEVDLHAPDTSFITVLSDDVSDASDDDTDPLFWHIFAAWEVIPTGLGDDLSKLYGMVVKHYKVNPLAGNGLILWGDLHVLFESTTGGSSVEVWNDQQEWVIHNIPYPLSASLMKKMLKHKLEVEIDGIGNDMTYAVQLIQFIKNQLASFFLVAGPIRLASPRVNGYLVKASSNPFTFYDLPLPKVNTPWDVMRIKSLTLVAAIFAAVSILNDLKSEDLSRKLEVNYVKFQFRGGLLVPTGRYIVPAGYIVPTGRTN